MELLIATPAAAGGAGVSVASVTSEVPVRGYIEWIGYTYGSGGGACPGTTTITITENGGQGRTLLAVPAGNTSGVSYPRAAAVTTANAAVAASWVPIYMDGISILVSVAAANVGSLVTVRIGISYSNSE